LGRSILDNPTSDLRDMTDTIDNRPGVGLSRRRPSSRHGVEGLDTLGVSPRNLCNGSAGEPTMARAFHSSIVAGAALCLGFLLSGFQASSEKWQIVTADRHATVAYKTAGLRLDPWYPDGLSGPDRRPFTILLVFGPDAQAMAYHHAVIELEADCRANTSVSVSEIRFDRNGEILATLATGGHSRPIDPSTPAGAVAESVCKALHNTPAARDRTLYPSAMAVIDAYEAAMAGNAPRQ
jgi:hypothetical protein